MDAYDVIVARNRSNIAEAYLDISRKTAKNVIISQDLSGSVNAVQWFINIFKYPSCLKSQLNTGTFIGNVKDLKILFGFLCSKFDECNKKGNEQKEFINLCKKNEEWFQKYAVIDHDKRIFCVLGGSGSTRIDLQTYLRQESVSKPCIIHCPGACDMFPLITYLGYKVEHDMKAIILKRLSLSRQGRIKQVVSYILIILLVIACFVFLVYFTMNKLYNNQRN